MRKILLLTLSILLVTGMTFAQKGNDGGGSKKNNNNNDKKDNNGGGGSCGNLGSSTAMFGSYQKNMLAKSSSSPTIMSIEAMALGGYGMISTSAGSFSVYNLMPRVKLNFGALSGDIRYNFLILTDASHANVGQTADALLEFNIAPVRGIKIFIGAGLMYNLSATENNMYYEGLIGADIAVSGKKFFVTPEIRYIYDPYNKTTLNFEGGAKATYKLFNISNIQLYANAGFNYQKYTGGGMFSPYLGLSFYMN